MAFITLATGENRALKYIAIFFRMAGHENAPKNATIRGKRGEFGKLIQLDLGS